MTKNFWLWHLALLNLKRNFGRNVFVGAAVAMSFTGIQIFIGYCVWVEKYARANVVYVNQIGHIGILRQAGLDKKWTAPEESLITKVQMEAIRKALANEPTVAAVGESLQSMVVLAQGCRNHVVNAIGRDEAIDERILLEPDVLQWAPGGVQPRAMERIREFRKKPSRALPFRVPLPVLERLKAEDGSGCSNKEDINSGIQVLARTVAGYPNAADIVNMGEQSSGGIQEIDARSVFFSTQDLQKLLETDLVAVVSVYLKDITQLPIAYWRLSKALAHQGDLRVRPFFIKDLSYNYLSANTFTFNTGLFFLSLVVAVVGMILGSLFSMSLSERSTELGILGSIGFPSALLSTLMQREALILTVLSLVAGGCLSKLIGAFIYLRNIPFNLPGLNQPLRLSIVFEPFIAFWIAFCFLAVAYLAFRFLLKRRLEKTPLELLQSPSTLK